LVRCPERVQLAEFGPVEGAARDAPDRRIVVRQLFEAIARRGPAAPDIVCGRHHQSGAGRQRTAGDGGDSEGCHRFGPLPPDDREHGAEAAR